jgi:hypothetical protein
MNNRSKIWVLLPFVALCACGKMGDLEPQAGSKPIPVAYGRSKAETADELVTASAQARPGRSVELLRRSERREIDPFDLPPGIERDAAEQTGATDSQTTGTEQAAAATIPKNR